MPTENNADVGSADPAASNSAREWLLVALFGRQIADL